MLMPVIHSIRLIQEKLYFYLLFLAIALIIINKGTTILLLFWEESFK